MGKVIIAIVFIVVGIFLIVMGSMKNSTDDSLKKIRADSSSDSADGGEPSVSAELSGWLLKEGRKNLLIGRKKAAREAALLSSFLGSSARLSIHSVDGMKDKASAGDM